MGPWQLGELTVEEPSRSNRGLHSGESGKQGLIQDTS